MGELAQENLELVMIDFFGALRRGSFETARSLLDPDVVWQGIREEWACRGPDEVLDTLRWGMAKRRNIDAIEFRRGVDRVVLGVRGPTIVGVADIPLEGQIFHVYTLRDGLIVRIDDYRRRSEAFAAAGLVAGDWW